MRIFVLTVILTLASLVLSGKEKLTLSQVLSVRNEALTKPLPVIQGWTDDRHYLEVRGRKLFEVDAAGGSSSLVLDEEAYKTLAGTGLSLMAPEDRTPDWERFLFVKGGELYLFQRATGQLRRVPTEGGDEKNPRFSPDGNRIAYTAGGNLFVYDIREGCNRQLTRDGSEEILNGYASWVYYEEILGRASRYRAFWWSPDGRRIAFLRFDQSKVPVFPIFNAEGVYGTLEKQRYPKPGFPNPEAKLGIADVSSGTVEWIPIGGPEDHYLALPVWSPSGEELFFQWLNRGQDHLKILAYAWEKKSLRTAYEERQEHWVDFLEDRDFQVLKNGDLVIRSSRDGWFHIYLLPRGGGEKRLTFGEWSVRSIDRVSESRKTVFFSAARDDSTETGLFRVPLTGGALKKLTEFRGSHFAVFSKEGAFFTDRYSSVGIPWRLDLRSGDGRLVRLLGDSRAPGMDNYELAKAELFRIPTEDGYQLPAVWYLPPGLDRNKKYPVILSVYGGPAVPVVANSFGRGWINQYLAQEGIIAMSVDHRGSGHFGKKGADLMHRCLGKWEMHDLIQTVKYLRTLPFVDTERIGISGGSYGGYVTALALASASDYFKFGVAEFSVTDWALYDSVYTERYMDTPAENPDGYKSGSVLTYVDRCRGTLRITHGSMDDNVHLQNTLQLVSRMLDAGKRFELMIYPGERHGFRGKKGMEAQKTDLDFWFRHLLGRAVEQ